ncbi:MAG TPA: hypothetical protein VII17_01145, partial [Steroidobacteraceae bacterium]
FPKQAAAPPPRPAVINAVASAHRRVMRSLSTNSDSTVKYDRGTLVSALSPLFQYAVGRVPC